MLLTDGCGLRLSDHLLHGDRLHDQVGALHDQPALLVLAGVQQQAALVEEGQPLGAVVAGHLDAQRAAVEVPRQAALQGKGVATLQAAVALWQGESSPRWIR